MATAEVDDIRLAECLGLRWGINLAKDTCFQHLIAETDNADVITNLLHYTDSPTFNSAVFDCLHLPRHFSFCTFSHVKHDGNKVAHTLAQLACSNPGLAWIEEFPQEITTVVIVDCMALFD